MSIQGIILAIKIILTLFFAFLFSLTISIIMKLRNKRNDEKRAIEEISKGNYIIDGKKYDIKKELEKETKPKTPLGEIRPIIPQSKIKELMPQKKDNVTTKKKKSVKNSPNKPNRKPSSRNSNSKLQRKTK